MRDEQWELFKRAVSGDEESARLVRLTLARFARTVVRTIGRESQTDRSFELDDLVSVSFARLFQSYGGNGFEPRGGKFTTLEYAVVHNTYIDLLRRQKARSPRNADPLEPSSAIDPEGQFRQAEIRVATQRALKNLRGLKPELYSALCAWIRVKFGADLLPDGSRGEVEGPEGDDLSEIERIVSVLAKLEGRPATEYGPILVKARIVRARAFIRNKLEEAGIDLRHFS